MNRAPDKAIFKPCRGAIYVARLARLCITIERKPELGRLV